LALLVCGLAWTVRTLAQPPGMGTETATIALPDEYDQESAIEEECGVGASAVVAPMVTGKPVYARHGGVIEHEVDLSIPGPVQAFRAERSYNSRTDGSVLLGGKWVGDFVDYRLGQSGDDVELIVDATSKRVFTSNAGTYASKQFTYYTEDVKTDNSGSGLPGDPKCVTVWNSSGENLESTYGGSDADEVDSANDKYLVKSETVGGCSSCGGGSGSLKHEYFLLLRVGHRLLRRDQREPETPGHLPLPVPECDHQPHRQQPDRDPDQLHVLDRDRYDQNPNHDTSHRGHE